MGEIKNLFRASNVSMYILPVFFPCATRRDDFSGSMLAGT